MNAMIWVYLCLCSSVWIASIWGAIVTTTLTGLQDTIATSITSQNQEFVWLVAPTNPVASNVQITFTSISIVQAELIILDGKTETSPVLFTCVSCGSLLPPTFYSTTGNIYVVVSGVAGISFTASQFSFRYVAIPTTRTSSLSNITTQMYMGTARLTPITFGGIFPAGYVQRWIIRAGAPITFSFSNFSFPVATCSAALTVYDSVNTLGKVLYQGCLQSHQAKFWFYSTTGVALVIVNGGLIDSQLDFELTYVSDNDWYQCGSFSQPAVMQGNSMILTDGTQSTKEMRRSVACTWLIAPSTATPVTLIFDWAQLKFGGSVTVYDGSSTNLKNAVLWSGIGATTITPPPITSTGNALFVAYISSSQQSLGYRGFRAQYQSNRYGSVGQGRGYSIMSMSTAIDIMPPGDALYYSSNLSYTWNIVPTSVSGSLTFALSFIDLSSDEQLVLYNGPSSRSPVLKVFRGDTVGNVWYKTSNTNATLVFTSKRSQPRIGGFRLTYFGDGDNYHCGFTTNPVTLTTPSLVITDGSYSSDNLFSDQDCEWNISPQRSQGVFLFFTRFSLHNGASLNVFNGSVSDSLLVSSMSESDAVPVPIVLDGISTMGVSYSTSSRSLGLGFSASYFGLSSDFSGPGDGIVWLKCSSILSLPVSRTGSLPQTNMTYILKPQATGSIFITFASLNLPDCSSRVDIYDGVSLSATLLASYCGKNASSTALSWVQTTSPAALIHFVSNYATPSNMLNAFFELAYFSRGANYHCGFHNNPGRHITPSMIFTDGSPPGSAMYPNQHCEWLLSPNSATNVVLQFLVNDMMGGEVVVHDGSDDTGDVLWVCSSCRVTPQTIVSSGRSLYVIFTTSSLASLGAGFTAAYWSTNENSWVDSSSGYLLEVPLQYTLNAEPEDNSTGYWYLEASYSSSTLQFSPTYTTTDQVLTSAVDGRTELTTDQFSAVTRYQIPVCGNVISGAGTIIGSSISQRASQKMNSYLTAGSATETTKVVAISGSMDTSTSVGTYDLFMAAQTCKYEINSGSILSVIIKITNYHAGSHGSFLRVYGGLNNNDALLFSSASSVSSVSVTAPCGRAMVVISTNESISRVDYGFEISYAIDPNDGAGGEYLSYACNVYRESLLPKKKKVDIYMPIYFAAGAFGLLIILCCFSVYIYRHYGHRDIDCTCIVSTMSRPVYQRMVRSHPRYTPRLDAFKNKFLPVGKCCVCQDEKIKVIQLSCNHGICMEDIKGYLESALGNIALFPVKCPMHYESCPGMIGPDIAKRFLSQVQYEKFVEFSDRALYGEGMRCIFCNNYVNLPSEGHTAACVECPYCVRRFCMRCKKPWHFGGRCPLDHVDDSLESWKRDSGAQKCPSCRKLIEKDDPDTCNHMVHKITDGIPCIRDRTDFCYLCGEEVLPDYPHNEVRNAGVNHFPEGVFQKCRVILQKERDAERDKLKKAKRLRGNKPKQTGGVNMDGWGDDDNAVGTGTGENMSLAQPDRFDEQWNIAMNDSPTPTGNSSRGNGAIVGGGAPTNNNVNTVNAPTVPPRGSESPTRTRPRAASNTTTPTAAAGNNTPPPVGSPTRPRRTPNRQSR